MLVEWLEGSPFRTQRDELEYAGELLHGGGRGFESPRLHDLEGSSLSTQRDTRHEVLPFALGAFDLDGTVLRRDLRITARTVAALDRLRESGMRLVVATGRRFEGAREHAERLGFASLDPLICYGGSMIRQMNGETLLHHTLQRDLGVEVLEWA